MIIGICGRKGHGKSALAKLILQRFRTRRGILCYPMATPIKEMCRKLGLSYDQCYGDLKEVPDPRFGNKTPREIMQTLGTEWGRQMIDDNIWANAWKSKVEAARDSCDVILCDDIRFENEVNVLREVGGFLIGVVRPGMLETVGSNHESETLDIQKVTNLIVRNDGTLDDMYHQAICLIEG